MRLLWHSNAPYVPTGYGNQSALFTPLLKADGYDVIQTPTYGHQGAPIVVNGVSIRSTSFENVGNDVLPLHRLRLKPDLMIGLYDIWGMSQDVAQAVGDIFASWCPVDREPLAVWVKRRLKDIRWKLAMSCHGEQMMLEAGFKDVFYIPHGVDTKTFQPIAEREVLRQRLGWDGHFVVMMNAANKVLRKNIHVVIQAFAQFVKQHPDAKLYLHTYPYAHMKGLDLPACVSFYGLTTHAPYGDVSRDDAQVMFPDFYRYQQSLISSAQLNEFYNGADVLLAPSRGEGFGIPVVEAQSAGCPVIVTNFSAQTELCGAGMMIEPAWLEYTDQGGEMAMISPKDVIASLEWAYSQRTNAGLREQARTFAMDYDFIKVYKDHWQPALDVMLDVPKQRQQRTAQRLALRQAQQTELVA